MDHSASPLTFKYLLAMQSLQVSPLWLTQYVETLLDGGILGY